MEWIKVVARNPKALDQNSQGGSQFGQRTIIDQVQFCGSFFQLFLLQSCGKVRYILYYLLVLYCIISTNID